MPPKPAKKKSKTKSTPSASRKGSATTASSKDDKPAKAINKCWFVPTASVVVSTIILCGVVVFVVPAYGLPELVSDGMFNGELPADTNRLGNEEVWAIILSVVMMITCIGLIVHNYMVAKATWDEENIKEVGIVWKIVASLLVVLVFLLVVVWVAVLIYCVVGRVLFGQIGEVCRVEFATLKNNSAFEARCMNYSRYGLPSIKTECGVKNIVKICTKVTLVEPSLTQCIVGAIIVLLATVMLVAIQAVNRRVLLLSQKMRAVVKKLKSVKPPSPQVQVKVVTLPGKTVHREDSESSEEGEPEDVLSIVRKKLSLTSADELELVYL